MPDSLKYGVVFPQLEIGADPIVLRDYAQTVEGLGFDYLLAYDHVLGANPDRPGGWKGPYTHTEMFHEPFVLFGYLAGLTRRLEFATGILILPQRQTALVAKQAAQVDVLSGGRLRLGVGIGWNQVEYEALGEDFHTRGKRIEEQVQVLRALWSDPLVTFAGENHSIPDAGLNPMPVQRPIPVWFGGMADVVIERMARLGDGWMPNPTDMQQARRLVDLLHAALERHGRRPQDFGIDIRISAKTQPRAGWTPFIEAWRGMGATHAGFNTMGAGYATVDDHLNAIRQFKEEMGF
jgi:probable F420-dependent oxidoreductase